MSLPTWSFNMAIYMATRANFNPDLFYIESNLFLQHKKGTLIIIIIKNTLNYLV